MPTNFASILDYLFNNNRNYSGLCHFDARSKEKSKSHAAVVKISPFGRNDMNRADSIRLTERTFSLVEWQKRPFNWDAGLLRECDGREVVCARRKENPALTSYVCNDIPRYIRNTQGSLRRYDRIGIVISTSAPRRNLSLHAGFLPLVEMTI
jgi:hypothetical protein